MNKHPIFRSFRFLLFFFLFGMIAGCSSTRLAYNYLDWIISWNLDDYINLNNDQKDWFDRHLDAVLMWHRKDQLPQYVQFIEQFQQDVDNQITVELLQQRFETIQDFWRDIMLQAEPDISYLLLWLDQDQRQEVFEKISKKQKKLEKKIPAVSPEKRKQKRIKRTEKVFNRFIGKLTSEQKAELENWADKLIPSQRLWLENRRTWQLRLKEVLNGNESETYKREQIQRLFVEPDFFWSKEYRHAFEQNQLRSFSLIVSVYEQLNEKQNKFLRKKLRELKEDFIHLSNK